MPAAKPPTKVPHTASTDGLDAYDLTCDDVLALARLRLGPRAALVPSPHTQAAVDELAERGLLARHVLAVYTLVPGAELPDPVVDSMATSARQASVLAAVQSLFFDGAPIVSATRIGKVAGMHKSYALACLHKLLEAGHVQSYRAPDRRSKERYWGLPLQVRPRGASAP